MSDYLVDHARKNIWCNPEQDNQHIVAPFRITPVLGVVNFCNIMMKQIALPTAGSVYHVFQIGQISPILLGLFNLPFTNQLQNTWIPFSDSLNAEKMIVDIYTDSGIQLPRQSVYYLFTTSRDLVIAVRELPTLPIKYQTDQIYLRVYTNAYFASTRSDQSNDSVFNYGLKLKTQAEVLETQILFESYRAKPGLTYGFVNGYLVDRLDLITMSVGDQIDFVYDSSIVKVVELRVGDLPVFNSQLDGNRKYLLHYLNDGVGEIEYHDDMDVFLVAKTLPNRYVGVYYHKNTEDAVKMVTHRDYSIPVNRIVHFSQALQSKLPNTVIDVRDLVVRLHIRQIGLIRYLGDYHNNVHELYKLSDDLIQEAMTGVNSVVPEWQADNLEADPYTAVIQYPTSVIPRSLVQDAMGYYALSELFGRTPSRPFGESGFKRIDVPYGLQQASTAYEYDADGLFLGAYHHIEGSGYTAVHAETELIEMISGLGGPQPDVRFGIDGLDIPTVSNYRIYKSHVTTAGYDEHWTDITGGNDYKVVNNKLVWLNQDFNQFLMLRTDARFLSLDFSLPAVDGILQFSLYELEDRNGEVNSHILPVSLGELKIILNRRTLIENIDYIVQFPKVVIINKRFLKTPVTSAEQQIHVRFTGFCRSDLTRDPQDDYGYIEHGVLSNNNRFDIRDNKVLSIVIDGKVCHRDTLKFSETDSVVRVEDVDNGKPYLIEDIIVPLKQMVDTNTYVLRDASIEVDKRISEYLTLKVPQSNHQGIASAITHRIEVYSPFLSQLIYDMLSEQIPTTALSTSLSDNAVEQLCSPYTHWLKFDPTQAELELDMRYVIVHPHADYSVIELNLFQYRFLRRVVELYCGNQISLSPFIALKPI